jgi:hypothetical protein
LAECLGHVALAAVTALGWLGAGSLVLAPLRPTGDGALDLLTRIGAGAVAFALGTFAVGWLGLLYAALYVPVLGVAAAAGLVVLVRSSRGVRWPALRQWPHWQMALAALLALYVVVDVAVTCAPISSADALFYHATAPELFEREHRIEEIAWSWHSYQPFTVELLVLDGFLLWDSVQGAFAPLLLGLGAAGVIMATAHRLAGRGIALLATALYLAQPFALWLLTSTFVEPAAAFTAALAVAHLVQFAQRRHDTSIALAGLFAGATAGMKYVAAGAAAIVALGAALAFGRALTVRRVLAFAIPAVVVALPWYVKNAILTGDPAYPILFGWEHDEAREAAQASFDNYGYGHGANDLLLLPVRLLADAEPFDRAEFITPLLLVFAPVALLAPRARRVAATALAGVGVYLLVWFFGVQDARYLLIAMPVLAVLAAVGIVALAREGRVGRVLAVGGTVGAFAVGAVVSAAYASQFVPYLAGTDSDDEFLRSKVSYHESVEWLNAHLPPDARVAVDFVFVLHVDRPAVVLTSDALTLTAGPRETCAFFRRYGLTHVLLLRENAARRRQLGYVGGRRIAAISARAVESRTLSRRGPPEQLDVYRVGRCVQGA